MSASPDLYVPRIGALLGFHESTCTEVRWKGDALDGRLAGPNCRGAEKSHRLQALRSRHPGASVVAYGNTASDLDHMRLCEASVYVNARGSEAGRLAAAGIRVVQWR
jgi:phosphatidylglycerophosphatase C